MTHVSSQAKLTEQCAHILTSMIFVSTAVALLYASSQIRFYYFDVPFTLQSYVVILIALVYPSRLSTLSVHGYLTLAMLGYPVLATTDVSGSLLMPATSMWNSLSIFVAPTGGYLIGFFVSTVLLSVWEPWRRDQGVHVWLYHAIVAHSAIWICGAIILSTHLGVWHACCVGILPFLLTDSVKVVAAVATARFVLGGR